METIINFFAPNYPEYQLDRNINQIHERMMDSDNMVCLLDCIDRVQYGIYMIAPEGGLFISYTF